MHALRDARLAEEVPLPMPSIYNLGMTWPILQRLLPLVQGEECAEAIQILQTLAADPNLEPMDPVEPEVNVVVDDDSTDDEAYVPPAAVAAEAAALPPRAPAQRRNRDEAFGGEVEVDEEVLLQLQRRRARIGIHARFNSAYSRATRLRDEVRLASEGVAETRTMCEAARTRVQLETQALRMEANLLEAQLQGSRERLAEAEAEATARFLTRPLTVYRLQLHVLRDRAARSNEADQHLVNIHNEMSDAVNALLGGGPAYEPQEGDEQP